jgi:predicted PurR-regulated permease PerM
MITDAQKWLIFSGIILGAWLIYLLAPVLTPFLAGTLLAYLGDPLVDRLEKYKISRTFGVVIVFTCMIFIVMTLLLILIPLIENQISSLIKLIPAIINWIENVFLPGFSSFVGIEIGEINFDDIKQKIKSHWQDIGNVMHYLFTKATQSGQVLLIWLAYIVLIPVVTFYLLRDWDPLVAKTYQMVPRKYAPLVSKLAKECDRVLAEFLHGQLLVMLGNGIIYSVGLWIVGLEFALLIGMVAGVLSFIPYLGFMVGIVAAGVAAYMQFHDVIHLVYVVLVFGIGQAIEGMLLSPMLVGDRIGLHPVAVIFAVMAGGQLFGFFGVLLALPVAAVIVVLLRYLHSQYLESSFYTP